MTINSDKAKSGPFIGDGVRTVFPYYFKIYDKKHLRAYVLSTAGVERVLLPDVNFTVQGVGNAQGTITFKIAPLLNEKIIIVLTPSFTQQDISLATGSPFLAEVIEKGFDLATQKSIVLKEELSRCVKFPVTADNTSEINAQLTSGILALGPVADDIAALGPVADDIAALAPLSSDIELIASYGPGLTAGLLDISEVNAVGDGITTAWALPRLPRSDENIMVWVGGALLATSEYSVVGSNLIITPAVLNGMVIKARVVTVATSDNLNSIVTQSDANADRAEAALAEFFTTGAAMLAVKLNLTTAVPQSVFTLSAPVPTVNGHLYIHVYVNGLIYEKDGVKYTASGTTLTFATPVAAGTKVYVEGAATYAYSTYNTAAASGVANDSGVPGTNVAAAMNSLLAGEAPFAIWPSGTLRKLKERLTSTYSLADAPGAPDPTGNNSSAAALHAWINDPAAQVFELPLGRFILDDYELLLTRPNITIRGFGPGSAGGGGMPGNWETQGRGSAIVLAGTGQRYRQTFRNPRLSAADPVDAPLSCGISSYGYGHRLERFAILLHCDYTDLSPSNLGADWDIGLMARRSNLTVDDVAVIGYFRDSNIRVDYSHCSPAMGITPLQSPQGVVFAGSAGADQQIYNNIKCWGGVKSTFAVMGRRNTSTGYFYDESIGTVTEDFRGGGGASNISINDASSWLFGHDHHSGVVRWRPSVLPDPDDFPEDTRGVLFLDGALNPYPDGAGRGFTIRDCRISSREILKVHLDFCDRTLIDNIHVDNRGTAEAWYYGPLIATRNTSALTWNDINRVPTPAFSTDRMLPGKWSIRASDTTSFFSLEAFETQDIRARRDDDELNIRSGANAALRLRSGSKTTLIIPAAGTYETTTASAPNTYVGADAVLKRSTSSIKYKKEIDNLKPNEAFNVLKARPVKYKDKASNDGNEYIGLIAEELALIDPRYVQYNEETGEPDGVMYDRLVVPLFMIISLLMDEVSDLKAKIENDKE